MSTRSSRTHNGNDNTADLVRKAVARQPAGRTKLVRSVPTPIREDAEGSPEAVVHVLELERPRFYAWVDAADDEHGERIIIVRGSEAIDSPERAVEAARAQEEKGRR
jgi:hypothetical protein